MEKKAKLDKFDNLILNKFDLIKKYKCNCNEQEFFELFIGAKIKDPMKYLISLVQKKPSYAFKNMDEVWGVLNFFGFEFFDSQELYDLGGTKLFTKLIKKNLSGKYDVDEYGRYDGSDYFNPINLLDTYLEWKYKRFDDYPWDRLWKTFEKLPKLKLYQTIVIKDGNSVYWETNFASKIGWILSETYSDEQVYKDMKQEILQMAKKQKLKVFVKGNDDAYFVKEEDAKYFIESSEYKLIQ